MKISLSAIGLSLAAVVASSALADGQWQILTVADGATTNVPGFPKNVWVPNQFNNPTISADGKVAFRGQMAGPGVTTANSRIIVRGDAGGFEVLAREGFGMPGDLIPGVVFNTASGVNGLASGNNMSRNGGVIVSGSLNGKGVSTANDTAAFFVAADGTPSLLAREGTAYPGGGGSIMTTSMSLSSGVRVSNDGEFYLLATLSGGDVSGSTNNNALVRFTAGGPEAIFRKGDAAPGFSDGTTMTPDSFGLNLNGDAVEFGGTLVGGSVLPSSDKARFTTLGGAGLRMYCREGDPVPGLDDTNYKASANFSISSQPMQGDAVIFMADFDGAGVTPTIDDRAILAERNGTVEVLLRRGESVPGITDGTVFGTPNTTSFLMSTSGMLAFQGILQNADGTAAASNATYVGVRKADGTKITICRQGEPVPGIEGATFGSMNGSTSICVSASGVVAFANSILRADSSTAATLFAWDEVQGLRVLASAGDTTFTGTPCTQLSLIGSTGQNGNGSGTGLNDAGTLVIRAGDTVNAIYAIATIDLAHGAACSGDFDGDGKVDGADLATLLGSWGTDGADLTGDGNTDGADLAVLLGAWGDC